MSRRARQIHCHKMVADTAKGMAAAVYEELAKNNAWYELNRSQQVFVEKTYGSLIEQARQVLAQMLSSKTVEEQQKEIIFEALLLDKSLQQGRGVRSRVINLQ
jgi:hypothetical protein